MGDSPAACLQGERNLRRKPKYLRRKQIPLLGKILIALGILGIIAAGVWMCVSHIWGRRDVFEQSTLPSAMATEYVSVAEAVGTEIDTPPTEQAELASTEPDASEQYTFLPYLAEKREQNPDVVGWIKIEGTKVDYPVMHTPDDPEKYLHLNFNEKYSFGGLPFIDANCTLFPENDNLIIYGHNMLDGSMFRTLMKYEKEDFWQAHPTIRLDIKDEEREYEIVSVFRDRVYYSYEDCFKFYYFYDAYSKEALDEAVDYYQTHALYDTGVSIEMGDRMITLVTCAYHTDNGRFVVVAREAKTPTSVD